VNVNRDAKPAHVRNRLVLDKSTPPQVDEMDDSSDMPPRGPLREILEHCQECVLPAYQNADKSAIKYQRRYRRRAVSVAILGSAAVLLATFELSNLSSYLPILRERPWLVTILEVLAGLSTLLIVLFGMGASLKQQWLLARFKAESLRLLKFASLHEAGFWSGERLNLRTCKKRISDKVEEIISSSFEDLEEWVTKGRIPEVVSAPPGTSTGKEPFEELVVYYQKKRLDIQCSYLRDAVHRDREDDRRTRMIPPVLFFGSVSFVLAHLSVEVAHGSETWNRFLILLAAALPAMGAGFRIYRSANESARNASRFKATHHVLLRLSERLDSAKNAMDVHGVFREIGFCERVLESDHREWMRLMVEAEWFG
jgi:hypothetical protein